MTDIFKVGSKVRVKKDPWLPEGVEDSWVGVEGIVVGSESHSHLVKVTADPHGAYKGHREGSTCYLVNLELVDGTVIHTEPKEKAEAVDHPSHYGGDTPYEVIKVAEAWGLDADAYLFNALKYIGRAGKKDDFNQDLKKAVSYLQRRIDHPLEAK